MPHQDQGESSFEKTKTVPFGNTPTGELQLGSIVGGSYRLKSILGRGGMGVVYLEEHQLIQRQYALKALAPDKLTEANCNRFQSEGKAIAKLEHHNIVKIYDMGIANGACPFYVMDLLEGPSLADFIRTDGPLNVDQAVDIFTKISLSDCGIDDTKLKAVYKISSATSLTLGGSSITVRSVGNLDNLRRLIHVSLKDSDISKADIDELKHKIPNCTFEWR